MNKAILTIHYLTFSSKYAIILAMVGASAHNPLNPRKERGPRARSLTVWKAKKMTVSDLIAFTSNNWRTLAGATLALAFVVWWFATGRKTRTQLVAAPATSTTATPSPSPTTDDELESGNSSQQPASDDVHTYIELNIVSSLLLFGGLAWLISVLAGLLVNLIIPGIGVLIYFVGGVGLTYWILTKGKVRNTETERSVIAFFDAMSPLVSGPGLTFTLPPPIGSRVRPSTTERLFVNASVQSENHFTDIKTRDGATMDMGGDWEYIIENPRQYAQFSREEHARAVRSLIDRVLRLIALYFDSDEDHSKGDNTGLAQQKLPLSKFFLGTSDKPLEGMIGWANEEERIPKWVIIENDVPDQCVLLGIRFTRVNITDILEPQAVRKAREEAAKELAQREQETRDVDTLHETILRLMWGGKDLQEVMREKGCTIAKAAEHLEQSGRTPVMSREAAAIAARTARGDATQIIANGDFTTAEALRQGGVRRKT